MSDREIRRSAITSCALCHGPLTKGTPLFWRVQVDRIGVDATALRQVVGVETMIGNAALANVFTGDPVLGKPIGDRVDILICEPCALERGTPVGVIALMHMEAQAPNRERGE